MKVCSTTEMDQLVVKQLRWGANNTSLSKTSNDLALLHEVELTPSYVYVLIHLVNRFSNILIFLIPNRVVAKNSQTSAMKC